MSPFAVLGIDPTDDKRAIKRAYAAKLKATDVEADPKSFIALREALDQILEKSNLWLSWPEDIKFEPHQTDHQAQDQRIEGFAAIRALLAVEHWNADSGTELLTHVAHIIDSDEANHVESSEWVETRLAEMVSWHRPRTDCCVALLVRHYDWEGKDAADVPDAALDIVHRKQTQEFAASLVSPDSPHHVAWRTLQSSKVGRISNEQLAVSGENVVKLINTVKENYPGLAAQWNPVNAALWRTQYQGYQITQRANRAAKQTLLEARNESRRHLGKIGKTMLAIIAFYALGFVFLSLLWVTGAIKS